MMLSALEKLKKYNAKRDFKKTREPKGVGGTQKGKAPIFVVQKHAATRLHWDFRLALNGVLKSWAVTNEPVADPSVKRLAVRVEDHPISYATFSGDIPKGQYGGGHVAIWDNGTWEPLDDPEQGLKRGKLGFILYGKRMKGQWNLVRMGQEGKRENWLLIKGKDDHVQPVTSDKKKTATAKTTLPKAVLKAPRKKAAIAFDPVLALRVDAPPEGDGWLHEIKYDGYRALVRVNKGKATIVTRGGLDWTERFPAIAKSAEKLKVTSLSMDGEIVVYQEDGKTDFGQLQQTLSGDTNLPISFVAFDLLELNGKDYKKQTLLERKEKLRSVLKSKKSGIDYSDHVIGNGKKFFAQAKRMHLEGMISKSVTSPYMAGRKGDWVKVKLEQVEEFVIGGILRRSDNASRVGAVLLGQFENGDFVYKGKSGTGFPSVLSDDLLKKARPLAVKKSPFTAGEKPKEKNAEWLKPALVCMVHYTEMTADGRIRHGVFKGLREDKEAKQVKPEKMVIMSNADPVFSGIKISHPEKIVYPESGLTKKDVVAYYDRVADLILPYLRKRAVSIIRCPDGLVSKCFFQRHVEGKAGEYVTQLPIKEDDSGQAYFSIDTKQALLSMVQFGAIEFHPWGSKGPKFTQADRLVFDLDPDPKIDFPSLKAAAFLIRDRLKKIGLQSFVKTTGGKGLHVVIPIKPKYGWDDIKDFTRAFANELEKDFPDAFTTNGLKVKRRGKIFIDYLRNDEANTSVAPFSLRARAGAPFSMPLTWEKLKMLKSLDLFNLETLPAKLEDPWPDLDSIKQQIRIK